MIEDRIVTRLPGWPYEAYAFVGSQCVEQKRFYTKWGLRKYMKKFLGPGNYKWRKNG